MKVHYCLLIFFSISCSQRSNELNTEIFKKGHLFYYKADSSLVDGTIKYNYQTDTTRVFHFNDGVSEGVWAMLYNNDTIMVHYYQDDILNWLNNQSDFEYQGVELYVEKIGEQQPTLNLHLYNNDVIDSLIKQDLPYPKPEGKHFKKLLVLVNDSIYQNKFIYGYVKYYNGDTEKYSDDYRLR